MDLLIVQCSIDIQIRNPWHPKLTCVYGLICKVDGKIGGDFQARADPLGPRLVLLRRTWDAIENIIELLYVPILSLVT